MGNAIQRPKEQTSFDRKKARQSPPVSMRGVLIPQVCTYKHLGLVLSEPSHGATISPVYILPVSK